MADSLSTIGSIASFLQNNWNIPSAISGAVLQIVDVARQHVANYTGDVIGSNSISDNYQPPILDFARADLVALYNLDPATNDLSLAELTMGKSDAAMSADQYRMLGEMKLKALGRKIQYAKSLS